VVEDGAEGDGRGLDRGKIWRLMLAFFAIEEAESMSIEKDPELGIGAWN
jgi:hypothetical protein